MIFSLKYSTASYWLPAAVVPQCPRAVKCVTTRVIPGVRGNYIGSPTYAEGGDSASPHRLDLRLVYTFKRNTVIGKVDLRSRAFFMTRYPSQCIIPENENNASFALQHPNRVREINLILTNSLLSKTRVPLLASFPSLEYLRLESPDQESESPPLPLGFLGSYAATFGIDVVRYLARSGKDKIIIKS